MIRKERYQLTLSISLLSLFKVGEDEFKFIVLRNTFSEKYEKFDLTEEKKLQNLSQERERETELLLTLTRISKGEVGTTKGSFLFNPALTGDIDALDAIRFDVRLGPLFLMVQQHLSDVVCMFCDVTDDAFLI